MQQDLIVYSKKYIAMEQIIEIIVKTTDNHKITA